MLYLCGGNYDETVSCNTHSPTPGECRQTNRTLEIMPLNQGRLLSELRRLFILARDRIWGKTNKKLLDLLFLFSTLTSSHMISTLQIFFFRILFIY